jgi:hypothetical protein
VLAIERSFLNEIEWNGPISRAVVFCGKMKKTSFLVALLLLLMLFPSGVYAVDESVNLNDLRSFGVPCYQAERSAGNQYIDGVIRSDEFLHSNSVAYGKGLNLFSFGGAFSCPKEFVPDSFPKEMVQEVFVSYDREYLYLSARLNQPLERFASPRSFPIFGSSYAVTVEISLSPESTLPSRLSRLYQTYYFSAKDLSCSAVEGARIFSTSSGQRFVGKISTRPNFSEAFVSTQTGEKINGQWYQNKAVLTSDRTTVFECCIPLADLISPLSEEDKKRVLAAFSTGNDPLCGSLSLEWDCGITRNFPDGADSLVLSAGIPAKDGCPLSAEGENWQEYLCRQESCNELDFDRIGVPLYLVGEIPPLKENTTEADRANDSAAPPNSESSNSGDPNSSANPTSTAKRQNTFTETKSKSTTAKPKEEQGSAPWDHLPETFEFQGETTEWIFLESSQSGEGEEDETIGSVLLVVAGILLFSSAVIAAFFFRSDQNVEKVVEKNKKTKK